MVQVHIPILSIAIFIYVCHYRVREICAMEMHIYGTKMKGARYFGS